MKDTIDTTTDAAVDVETDAEKLARYEAVIEKGLDTSVEVGIAMLAIKAQKLYKVEGYSTFEDYCEKRWDRSRTWGHRLAVAASITLTVAENVLPRGDTAVPTNEKQARALAPLRNEPEAMTEAWVAAVEQAGGEQPTAGRVAEVVRLHPKRSASPVPTAAVASPSKQQPKPGTEFWATFSDIVIGFDRAARLWKEQRRYRPPQAAGADAERRRRAEAADRSPDALNHAAAWLNDVIAWFEPPS